MELKLRRNGGIYIIDIVGQIDLYNTNRLKDLFLKMVEKSVKKFVVNVQNVSAMDSSAIGTLINIYSIASQNDLKFGIINVTEATKRVMETTRLEEFFPVFENLDEALASMRT